MADYATVAQVKNRIDKTGDEADAWLAEIITAASRAIDNFCHRPRGFVADDDASARVYAGSGTATMRIDECIEITKVEVKDSLTDDDYVEWTDSDYIAFRGAPRDPEFNETPYDHLMVVVNGDYNIFTSGALSSRSDKDRYFAPLRYRRAYNPRGARSQPTVRVTAKWGYAETVPGAIREACAMQTARWFKRYQSAMSDVLASGELGKLFYRQELDPDVKFLLVAGRYVRPTVGNR